MGRVRLYLEGTDKYVSLRVEEHDLYLEDVLLRLRERSTKVPIKKQKEQARGESSKEFAARIKDPQLLQHLLEVLEDFEATYANDPKALVTLKQGYKGKGHQIGVQVEGDWTNFNGQSLLECLLAYHAEVIEP